MLKPIKNFLTYLQKNANGSAIFGLTPTMGPNEEEEPTAVGGTTVLESATTTTIVGATDVDIMTSGGDDLATCDDDPLYDPLALDDAAIGGDLNVSTDLDTSAGQITLVDVTSLKNSPAAHDRRDSREEDMVVETNGCNGVTGESVTISVNGQHNDSETSQENGHGEETKSTILEDDSFTTASAGGTPNATINGQCGATGNSNGGELSQFTEEQVPAVTTGTEAPTTQERQQEEEEASDGSDSGLGSEPSRNLTTQTQVVKVKSNLKRRSADEDAPTAADVSSEKRPKKGITFDGGVTVFYFTRMQGFGCVPSQGGCTLGMEFQHMHSRRFTLAEHAAEQRKQHRAQLQELNGARSSSSEETDSEEEPSESGSEAESESYGFLQPVTTRQRRALLKAAGVRKIDSTEKDECRVIRTSREVCGCTCRGYCDPDTCACSQAGIKCQVDRPNFPCGCTQDGCANVVGRVEFNPARVRTHFIHTIMRLNLENKASEDQMRMSGGGGSSYGSGKDWSSGPVRLPGLYGMMNGGDAVDGYHHQQQQPQQYGHGYQGAESLDLHYAFRDYYGTGQQHQQQQQPVASDQLSMMSSYYGNYATPMDQYHQPHHAVDQRQSDPHSSYHSQQQQQQLDSTAVIMDEDTTLNTPINPNFVCDDPHTDSTSNPPPPTSISSQLILATCSSSLDDGTSQEPSQDPLDSTTSSSFIDLDSPLAAPSSDRLEAINDLLASSRTVNVRRSIPEEDDELSDFRDPPVMPALVIDCDDEELSSSVTTAQDDTQESCVPSEEATNADQDSAPPVSCDKVVETSENLSEIIKNSIVETVSN